jgi:hypothetical protein
MVLLLAVAEFSYQMKISLTRDIFTPKQALIYAFILIFEL